MSVTWTVEDAVATVEIDREEKLNALDLDAFRSIESILDALDGDAAVRALIVRSAGTRAFSAGADIADLDGIDAQEASRRATYRRGVFQKLYESRVPSVAFIDGLALGGGVELALACSFRLATPRATLAFPEIDLGLLPGAGGTQRLPKLIGEARALEMMLTGRRVAAEEALRIGLIDRIVETAQDARQFARQWCGHSAEAVAAIKRAIGNAHLPLDQGLRFEGEQLALLNGTGDSRARIEAFLASRRKTAP